MITCLAYRSNSLFSLSLKRDLLFNVVVYPTYRITDIFIYTLYRIYDMYTRLKGGENVMGCYGGMCVPGRRFLTKEEKIEMLQEYHDYLNQEAKGVAERITELKNSTEDSEE